MAFGAHATPFRAVPCRAMHCTLRRCACRLQALVREKMVLADQVAERDEKLAKLMSESTLESGRQQQEQSKMYAPAPRR